MSNESQIPQKLRPYQDFVPGLHKTGTDWHGNCPFCDKDDHFYVNPETGQFDCKRCGINGNTFTFLRDFAELAHRETPRQKMRSLSKDRGIPVLVLKQFKVGWDGDQWLVPCYSHTGTVRDIRRYRNGRMMSTAGCTNQLFNMADLKEAKAGTRVWLCEGEWDAMAMTWLLEEIQESKVEIDDVVVAVPGAGTFKKDWTTLFSGMNVICVYDHDEAGFKGASKVASLLDGIARSLHFIDWTQDVEDPEQGYDLRDYITSFYDGETTPTELYDCLVETMATTSLKSGEDEVVGVGGEDEQVEPISWRELVSELRKRIVFNETMMDILMISTAAVLSSKIHLREPLWVFVVGPASGGKTLVLSLFSKCRRCEFVSQLTSKALISGWQQGGDPSLMARMNDRSLVVKDFTEVLNLHSTERDHVFAVLRGAYDGRVDRPFGNGINRIYEDLHFSTVAGVTYEINSHPQATMGERFLRFNMPRSDSVHFKEVTGAMQGSPLTANGEESEGPLLMNRFIQCTRIDEGMLPLLDPQQHEEVVSLCELTAWVRCTVSRTGRNEDIAYEPVPEEGFRLMGQLAGMASMISVLEGSLRVTSNAMRIVRKIALDSCSGFHFRILERMSQVDTLTRSDIGDILGTKNYYAISRRIEDMTNVGLIVDIRNKVRTGKRPASGYAMSPRIKDHWENVFGEINPEVRAKKTEKFTLPETNGSKPKVRVRKRKKAQRPSETKQVRTRVRTRVRRRQS